MKHSPLLPGGCWGRHPGAPGEGLKAWDNGWQRRFSHWCPSLLWGTGDVETWRHIQFETSLLLEAISHLPENQTSKTNTPWSLHLMTGDRVELTEIPQLTWTKGVVQELWLSDPFATAMPWSPRASFNYIYNLKIRWIHQVFKRYWTGLKENSQQGSGPVETIATYRK